MQESPTLRPHKARIIRLYGGSLGGPNPDPRGVWRAWYLPHFYALLAEYTGRRS